MKDPKPLPSGDPVHFAASDVDDAVWPVKTSSPRKFEVSYRAADGTDVGDNLGRQFLASRSHGTRHHVGVDLFAEHRDKVVACEDGRIVSFYTFYNTSTNEAAYALIIQHEDFVINYGEVKGNAQEEFNWRVGDRVTKGQEIARISTTGMLHFETYALGTAHNHQWLVGDARPTSLLNPTLYLLNLAAAAQGVGGNGGGERPLKHPLLAANDALQSAARGERAFMIGRDSGEPVGLVQDALDRVLPEADRINAGVNRGTFGQRTETAVKKFQQSASIKSDGLVGKDTLGALDAALLRLNGSSTFVRAMAFTNPRRVEYFDGNNCRQTKTGGSRSWRNNNPGNIICGPFTTAHGAIGCDSNTQPTAAIFPSMEVGRAAQVALLRSENYQNLTVGRAMDRWTGQENHTSYQACVHVGSGISMDRQMSSLSNEELVSLTMAMQHCEGFTEETISQLVCP
jgi:peptidoglycan hydrolase-like protein with peptidoglycan-binding domain